MNLTLPGTITLPALPTTVGPSGYGVATPPTSFAVVLGAVTEPPPRLAPLPLLLETGMRALGEGFGFPEIDAAEVEFEDLAEADLAALIPFPILMPMLPPLSRQPFALSASLEMVLDRAAPTDDLRTNLMLLGTSIEVDHAPAMPMATMSQTRLTLPRNPPPIGTAAIVIPSPVPADPIRDPGLIFEFPMFLPSEAPALAPKAIAAYGSPLTTAALPAQPVRTAAARPALGNAGLSKESSAPESANTSFELQRVAAANGDFDETATEGNGADAGAESSDGDAGAGAVAAFPPDHFDFAMSGALPVSTSELPLEKLAGVAGKIEALGEVQDAGATVGDRLTLRLDDALGHWEVDMVRHDELLNLVLRGDAELHRMVAEATPELVDRLAAEGLTLQRIEFAPATSARGETTRAVEAVHEGEGANFGENRHHHNPGGDGRREEAPPWPAKVRRAAIAGRIRDGLLNRAV